jgi:hypothetical protein
MCSFIRSIWSAIRLYHVTLVAGIILLMAAGSFPDTSFGHHLLRDIGIAFIVAFAVIVTIEHRQRRELSDSIEKFLQSTHEHLFQTILGVEFPQNVYDFIRDKVMKEVFYRKDTQVVFTLRTNDCSILKHGMKTVLLEIETSQKIVNLTDRALTYPARFFIEKDPTAGVAASSAPKINLLVDGVAVTEDQFKKAESKWEDTADFLRHQYDISMESRQTRSFKMMNVVSSKLEADTEIWRSMYPCDGLVVVVKFPDTFDVRFDAIHPDEIEVLHCLPSALMRQIG